MTFRRVSAALDLRSSDLSPAASMNIPSPKIPPKALHKGAFGDIMQRMGDLTLIRMKVRWHTGKTVAQTSFHYLRIVSAQLYLDCPIPIPHQQITAKGTKTSMGQHPYHAIPLEAGPFTEASDLQAVAPDPRSSNSSDSRGTQGDNGSIQRRRLISMEGDHSSLDSHRKLHRKGSREAPQGSFSLDYSADAATASNQQQWLSHGGHQWTPFAQTGSSSSDIQSLDPPPNLRHTQPQHKESSTPLPRAPADLPLGSPTASPDLEKTGRFGLPTRSTPTKSMQACASSHGTMLTATMMPASLQQQFAIEEGCTPPAGAASTVVPAAASRAKWSLDDDLGTDDMEDSPALGWHHGTATAGARGSLSLSQPSTWGAAATGIGSGAKAWASRSLKVFKAMKP